MNCSAHMDFNTFTMGLRWFCAFYPVDAARGLLDLMCLGLAREAGSDGAVGSALLGTPR